MKQFLNLLKAHFLELIREPGVLFWGIVFPILMSLGLGYAFTQKADVTYHVAYISNGPDSAGKSLLINKLNLLAGQQFDTTNINRKDGENFKIVIPDNKLGNTTLIFQKNDWNTAITLLKRGHINIIMEDKGEIIYHFDPLNPDAQLTFIKLSKLFSANNENNLQRTENIEPMSLKGTRYIDFLVPGLISMGAMMSCMWGLSYGIIDRRSKKLLRRMVATPMKKSFFLMSFITVRFTMNLIESALLIIFTWLVFGVTIQGNTPALLLLYLAGNVAFAGIAIFVSSHTSNTEIGNGLINAVVMPMMVLSGIFFSYHNFPDWSIPVIRKLPLTMLTDGIRSIFNEGAGFGEITIPAMILLTIGFVFFVIGLKIFKWH